MILVVSLARLMPHDGLESLPDSIAVGPSGSCEARYSDGQIVTYPTVAYFCGLVGIDYNDVRDLLWEEYLHQRDRD
jgi:hypothetical protein